MSASRIAATAAAITALLACGCGSGTGQDVPPSSAVGGPSATASPRDSTSWTLGGVPCALIPVPAAAPVGIGTCPGVRPGGIVVSDKGQCTLNFLFLGSDGTRYIGTAGHCILGDSPFGGDAGEMAWATGTGPEARDGSGARIGEFAYAILRDPKDFSLIRLDPQVQANAGMCHFGGPTATNDDRPGLTQPVVLNWFGNGVVVGAVLPARSALVAGMPSPDHVFAQGAAAPGDSGSGVISSDGRAVVVLVTVGVHTASIGSGGLDAGMIGITRLTPQVERAQQVLGVNLDLQKAPLQ
jgi:hypothetical protein